MGGGGVQDCLQKNSFEYQFCPIYFGGGIGFNWDLNIGEGVGVRFPCYIPAIQDMK